MADEVLLRLENELPPYLSYHNAAHTRYVLDKTALLADQENVFGRERLLLYLAALYHDSGFLINHDQHEQRGCKLAHKNLSTEGLKQDELEKICTAIMATAIPQKPESLIGAILADADLFYLGTDDYDFYADKLFRELKHFQPKLSESEWRGMQINFLEKHRYHTEYCKNRLKATKEENLKNILKRGNH